MKPAIRVENLSKQYRIGTAKRGAQRNLTESIATGARSMWRTLTGQPRATNGPNEFWALKDVSFDVQPGEVVGIIGRNGAGKSTLLKILSRIAEPTSGRAIVHGRLASLLEVGTGFHPELTGRENIYLNGSILGITRNEISRSFDEIVTFSEIGALLDTPVKRYSSGMYVKLAFAVAAHLQPEILVVDEVLAVGDIQFQKKCLNRMAEVSNQGKTVVFVSHQLGSIRQLCSRVILLTAGTLAIDATPQAAIEAYVGETRRSRVFEPRSNNQSAQPVLRRASLARPGTGQLNFGEGLELKFECLSDASRTIALELVIRDQTFHPIIFLPSGLRFGNEFRLPANRLRQITCGIPMLPLAEGTYYIDVLVAQSGLKVLERYESALGFEVLSSDPCGTKKPFSQQTRQGCVHVHAQFSEPNPTA